MGTRIQNLANNFTTAGIVKAAAINNTSVSGITSLPSGVGGALTLLQTQTASASATIDFTSNIDSTYKAYMFKFYDMHPATDNVKFEFQGSTDGGSSYGVTVTNTYHRAYHNESDSTATLAYEGTFDQAQSTAFATLVDNLGADADQQCSGTLIIYAPSDTTFVKHFISRLNNYHQNDYSMDQYTAGYFNTTSAVNAIQFKMSSGNTDAGVIKLYGVS